MLITASGLYEQGKNALHLCELLLAHPSESLDRFVPRYDIFKTVIANLSCEAI